MALENVGLSIYRWALDFGGAKNAPARRIMGIAFCACISIGALSAAVYQSDFSSLRKASADIPLGIAAEATGLLFAGVIFSAIRLRAMYAAIGRPLSDRDALLALSLGQIIASLTVQFFGQIFARTTFLRNRNATLNDTIVVAAYERLAAFLVSLALAVSGVLILAGRVVVDWAGGGAQLAQLVGGLCFSVFFGALFGWWRTAGAHVLAFLNPSTLMSFGRAAGLSAIIQICTSCAYALIASALAPHVPLSHIFAASFVVMFAASLPISFFGWGVRELTAVFALTSIGVEPAAALTTAIVVGTMALAAVIITATGAATLPQTPLPSRGGSMQAPALPLALPPIILLLCASFVIFQVRLPLTSGWITVNLADPLAILGAGIAISVAIISLLLAFVTFSAVHEILYQRSIWLLMAGIVTLWKVSTKAPVNYVRENIKPVARSRYLEFITGRLGLLGTRALTVFSPPAT